MTATRPTSTETEPMYLVVPDHTGCLQCGHVGTAKTRDAMGRDVSSWWVTETADRARNVGPFCSDYCAKQWIKEQG